MTEPNNARDATRVAVALGWLAGVMLALLVDYGAYVGLGDDYPKGYITFVLIVVFAFSGMKLAEKLGSRAVATMSLAVGLLLAAGLFVFFLP